MYFPKSKRHLHLHYLKCENLPATDINMCLKFTSHFRILPKAKAGTWC